MKKHLNKWIPFLIIIFVATALRFYQLGNVPIELNRDEASLGYTAYSLLQTGKEEHGQSWPINIESFGDWKLPAYVYTLIPFIKIFGLKAWVVKLPSALAGIGIVILSAVITWLLTSSWKDQNKRITLSTLVAFMITISPWNIHMSHMAYEANLGMLFLMTGVALLLTALQNKSKRVLLIPSAFFFGLTFFSYHSYQVFMPLLVLSFLSIYWKKAKNIFETEKKISYISIAIGALFTIALIATSLSANQTKLSGLSIFDKSSYSVVMEENRGYFENRNSLLAKLHSNNFYFIFNQAQRNIADIFSSKFLFFEGGSHGSHDIPGTGKMHPVAFIFLIIAGYKFLTIWQEKKLEKWHKVIMAWLLVSIVAPFITFEAAHTIRFSPALFSLEFLSAYGLFILLEKALKDNKYKIIAGLTIFILLYSFVYFFATYFFVAPKRDIDKHNWQIERLVELVNDRGDRYDLISMPGTEWSPYIYFLLFNQTDPNSLSKDLEFYDPDHEGFRHVKRLGNIHFSLIDWNDQSGKSVLYVIKSKEVPGDKLESEKYRLEYSLTNPYAKHEWLLLGRK
ncbi:MAG: hypothetical protein OEX81_00285 [Candidatus Pacebacteria bacterium]|nr:hypothetical protein [Candidatus Paceibacterota bacterium]